MICVSCSSDKEKISIIQEDDIEEQMIESFSKGLESLEDGDVLFAAKSFNEAEMLYPQSKWAPISSIMAAYSYYSQDYYRDAIYELERFIKVYPNHKRLDYVHFLLAMCYYENIVDEKKDLEPLLKAKDKFEFIIIEYPDTDFALDARFKIDLILDILAAKEIYIGKHYIKKQKWIAAINRFKKVVDDYDTTIHVEEALFRLVEIHYKIGLEDEAKKYASILGYNYLSSEWYEESYRILNPKYKTRREIDKEKERNFIIRKIKSLFE
tara:strand:- start:1012 stop:1812 length:801 start_codon:yes stop_codon:yes gene_type:complete